MRDIKLNRADMRGVTFPSSQGAKTSLSGAQMRGAILDRTDLSSIDLSLSSLYGASLIGASLQGAELNGVDLTGANLSGANMSGTELRLTALGFAKLDGASLSFSRVIGSDLTSASLVTAELSGATFYGTRFDKAVLWGASLPRREDLAWADLGGAILSKPPSAQLALIKASLDQIPEDIRRNFPWVMRFYRLSESDHEDDRAELESAAWASLKTALGRDVGNASYQQETSKIITENACAVASVSLAVERWLRRDTGYDITHTPGPPLPVPGADQSLEKVAANDLPTSAELEYWTSFYPDTVVPLPPWYDATSLIDRLANGTCPASPSINQSVLSSMRTWNESGRKKSD